MFRAIKRLFIWMGLMAEKATETDAINQAVVERGIRDSKAKADKAEADRLRQEQERRAAELAVDVPNGRYRVWLAAGDSSGVTTSTAAVRFRARNGVPLGSLPAATPPCAQWSSATMRCPVSSAAFLIVAASIGLTE